MLYNLANPGNHWRILRKIVQGGQRFWKSYFGPPPYLYEVLVTASLSQRKATRDELDTIYTYLSEFSYHLFVRRRKALTDDQVREWHEAHCRDYRLPLTD